FHAVPRNQSMQFFGCTEIINDYLVADFLEEQGVLIHVAQRDGELLARRIKSNSIGVGPGFELDGFLRDVSNQRVNFDPIGFERSRQPLAVWAPGKEANHHIWFVVITEGKDRPSTLIDLAEVPAIHAAVFIGADKMVFVIS